MTRGDTAHLIEEWGWKAFYTNGAATLLYRSGVFNSLPESSLKTPRRKPFQQTICFKRCRKCKEGVRHTAARRIFPAKQEDLWCEAGQVQKAQVDNMVEGNQSWRAVPRPQQKWAVAQLLHVVHHETENKHFTLKIKKKGIEWHWLGEMTWFCFHLQSVTLAAVWEMVRNGEGKNLVQPLWRPL